MLVICGTLLHVSVCRQRETVSATALVCRHGGTPNLSDEPRSLPNVEYFAPWFRSEYIVPSMPYERWEGLSEHGQRISRFVVVPKGANSVISAGAEATGRGGPGK